MSWRSLRPGRNAQRLELVHEHTLWSHNEGKLKLEFMNGIQLGFMALPICPVTPELTQSTCSSRTYGRPIVALPPARIKYSTYERLLAQGTSNTYQSAQDCICISSCWHHKCMHSLAKSYPAFSFLTLTGQQPQLKFGSVRLHLRYLRRSGPQPGRHLNKGTNMTASWYCIMLTVGHMRVCQKGYGSQACCWSLGP